MLLTQSVDDRVMLFLDIGSVSRSLETKNLEGFRVDWFRLAKHVAGTRRLVGAFAFDTAPEAGHANPKQRFHDHLRYTGFRLVTRPFRPDDRSVYDEVRMALGAEILTACHRDLFDVAIVVSADRTLLPILERVSREGKLVEVAAPSYHMTSELRKAADRTHHIDELPILEIMPEETEAAPEEVVLA